MSQNTRQIIEPSKTLNQAIDFTNIDDITASIRSFALEIENQPQQKSEQVEESNNSSPLELPCAPSAATETTSSACYFKTKSGGFKDYIIEISEGAIVFRRPKSTKQQELSYMLNTIQCLIRYTPAIVSRDSSITGEFCINLISSNSQQRSVYFDCEETMKHWHEEILTAQGFFNKRIDQYEPLGKLGEGSFGVVILSQHKNSQVKVAVKVIQKTKIDKVYKKNN